MSDRVGKARALLSWFVVRARRVEQHSLALDKAQLLRWAGGALTVKTVDGRVETVQWDVPAEEPLESLAGRCRPFLVPSDDLGWTKVVRALRTLLDDRGGLLTFKSDLEAVEAEWAGLDRDSPEPLGYQSRAGANGNELGSLFTDRHLAYAWLYGDLIHGDNGMPERVGDHDIDDRFLAASILVTRTAYCAIITLNLIRNIQLRYDLTLEDQALTRRVIARPNRELTVAAYADAPAGTAAAALEAMLPASGSGTVTLETWPINRDPARKM